MTKIKRTYGMTEAEYIALYDSQNGLCKICNLPPDARYTRLHIDHCHGSNKVRGLLCFKCNVALGNLNDDIELFKKAIAYLEEHTKHANSA